MEQQKILFDDGVREYEVNGNGILRFHPGDPNLYHRFQQLVQDVDALKEEALRRAGGITDGAGAVALLAEYDGRVKEKLSDVFGRENDFDKLLGGVNVMAPARNGQLIVTNFILALQPILEEGIRDYARLEAAKAAAAYRPHEVPAE
ncbi:hypothetical protein H7U37_08005 [Pseudoflavonifractor phocaeensis]|uniref:hypothetical protein n=1 Tax=Pseudoflavonifractor phocaeensis TaxID=1870988 RepID=UPI00195A659C|nr:hypothetical protein [Pseudoflavonifractor phocaeensis]MBM6938464.1 hypothetical protein [Pseudoflavonifractor phocaeensis]